MKRYLLTLFATLFSFFCPRKTQKPPIPIEAETSATSRVSYQESLPKPVVKQPGDVTLVSFQRDVLPILKELAGDCHTADNMAGNYALDSYEAVMAPGTDSVPNVIPGNPEKSLFYQYLLKGHPFGKKPDSAKLMTIRTWILQGAKNN